MLAAAVFVAAALLVAFVGFEWRAENLLREQQLTQARAFAEEIVATRTYVSMHGGVYVPLSSEATPSPYLQAIPGLKTQLRDEDGDRYVLQNPAIVTQEIGDLLAANPRAGAVFRLTSDKPLDPANLAQGFEADALRRFRDGAREYWSNGEVDGRASFQYARGLRVEAECLQCHRAEGYRVGDVRGAISIRIDAARLESEIARSRMLVGLAFLVAIMVQLGVLYVISKHLIQGLLAAEERLRQFAILDSLTGLDNRRMGMKRLADEMERAEREGSALAVVMLDLDEFKRVNDEHGHASGDAVLVAAARAMRAEARPYDTVARVGGEEFLVLLPSASAQDATAAVERIRSAIAAETREALRKWERSVTASAGIAMYRPGRSESADAVLFRADAALYAAKEAGRDRSMLAEDGPLEALGA